MQYDVSQAAPPRRLTRSRRERMIFGVAGGLADYFDLDPVVVRLLWVGAAVLTGGLAVPAYIVMFFVMPDGNGAIPSPAAAEPVTTPTATSFEETSRVEAQPMAASFDPTATPQAALEAPPWRHNPERRRRRQRTAGIILISLGVLFLAGQSGLFWWVQWRYVWPLILIAIGVGILLRQGAWRR